MRDFPSCFGESGVQISDSSSGASSSAQNLVTRVYKAQLLGRSCVIHVTWSKNLIGHGLSVGIDDFANQCLCKVEIKPWMFSKRKGSKILEVENGKIVVFWDLSVAKFGLGPEPLEGFYVAVVFDLEMVLLLGDLTKEAYRKTNTGPPPSNAVFIAKRVFYSTKAQFCDNGQSHEVAIECDTVGLQDPCLAIHIDRKRVMQIKRLAWKFRGNQTILVDGLPVAVFWDVHSWLFGPPFGSAVFVFQPQSCCHGLHHTFCGNLSCEAVGFLLCCMLGETNSCGKMDNFLLVDFLQCQRNLVSNLFSPTRVKPVYLSFILPPCISVLLLIDGRILRHQQVAFFLFISL